MPKLTIGEAFDFQTECARTASIWARNAESASLEGTPKAAIDAMNILREADNKFLEGTLTARKALANALADCGRRRPDSERNVHTEHCCAMHGCKYGDDSCPVVNGTTYQSFPCPDCED